ncbi:NAD-dependent protein deacylase [Inconstantimicrobium porci]|uniref:NAD-dependent protein deacetylase n=1 Tax=Inconstantimicrobium porci TaxID=2652291 RepID=A0A7X2T169_9CLOT|nr:NAD-dependent protein deacylase [Inconstantimicrobium porci]MSR91289.1 NAD-dependent protein deacylase [Inconstantimicrobium porci]
MSTEIEKLTQILRNSNNIVFFGGAGCSCESGIPDFRSAKGLWNEKLKINLTPEQLVSHTMFMRYPEEFFEFYRDKLIYPDAKPNAAHIALAKLEEMGKLKAIVTQNIDGLHQAAGSKNVYELHGSVLRNYCMKCGAFYDEKFILESKGIPTCPKCGGKIKPDVVLYEEGLDNDVINGAVRAISQADTLIIGGTSLVVYPAAGLIDYFRGKNLILINKSSTSADNKADLVIHDAIGKVLGEVVSNL